jgi:UDP-N-acetylglucosamine/UDP-N-acetylgalactosamine diphosphorylase
MHIEEAIEFLHSTEQIKLIAHLKSLSANSQKLLLKSIAQARQEIEHESPKHLHQSLEPVTHLERQNIKLITSGENVALVLLAGGLGTRLGLNHPKALFPILNKSLIERHLRLALKRFSTPPLIGIMTSESGYEVIKKFLDEHHFFSYPKEKISLFPQSNTPFFGYDDQWHLESPTVLATGPSGNGAFIRSAKKHGFFDRCLDLDIAKLGVIPIDNPIAINALPQLMTSLKPQSANVAVIDKTNELTSLGSIATDHRRTYILDYTDKHYSHAHYPYGNAGIFSFDFKHLYSSLESLTLPLHLIEKNVKIWSHNRLQIVKAKRHELFITDLLHQFESSKAILFDAHQIFLPIKDFDSASYASDYLDKLEQN